MAARGALPSAIGGCAVGFTAAWLIFRSDGTCKVEDADPSLGLQPVVQEQRATPPAPDLERPDNRVPVFAESPKAPEPPITKPSSTDAVPVPSQPESVGDRTTWPSEYANKSLADLLADAERLKQEFKKDIDAEFEKRFKDGRCETIPYESHPMLGKRDGISGYYRGRKVENTWQSITLDPSVEPDLFIKLDKAGWLFGEMYRRQH